MEDMLQAAAMPRGPNSAVAWSPALRERLFILKEKNSGPVRLGWCETSIWKQPWPLQTSPQPVESQPCEGGQPLRRLHLPACLPGCLRERCPTPDCPPARDTISRLALALQPPRLMP